MGTMLDLQPSPGRPSTAPQTMSSREIAELCETRHNQVVETIDRLFEKGVLRESRKTLRPYNPDGGGRPTQVYDLTKRDTLVVVSGYNDELRARIIDRWQELEERPALPALNDPATLRSLLLDNVEKVLALQGQVATLEPKAAALDRIASTDGSMNITEAAKTLQVAPRRLFNHLRTHRWIYRRAGSATDLAYQDKIEAGLMEHKVSMIDDKVRTQARVTSKGIARLTREFAPAQSSLLQ